MSEVVVITGASAGAGRAIVAEFAKRSAKIGLIARGKARLDAAGREARELGGAALALPADVADAEAIENAATQVEREFGPIDVWINCAMTTVFAPFTEITPAEFKRATEVTYLGFVYGTMAALKRMHARNAGAIVQVGSALSYRSIPLQSPYCGAKHAIVGFTDSIRSELIHEKSNVHITVVHFPAMNTPQFSWCRAKLPNHPQPVPPIYQPEVAARAVYWAAHQTPRDLCRLAYGCGDLWPGDRAGAQGQPVRTRRGRLGRARDFCGSRRGVEPSKLAQPAPRRGCGGIGRPGVADARRIAPKAKAARLAA